MDLPKNLQRLIAALPLELKINIIYYAVQVDDGIESTPHSAMDEELARIQNNTEELSTAYPDHDLIPNPTFIFTADAQLYGLAMGEFWKANTFEVLLEESTTLVGSQMQYECQLLDDEKRRLHARHVELMLLRRNLMGKMVPGVEKTLAKSDIAIIRRISLLYPKLQSLSVRVFYHCNVEPVHDRAMYEEPLRIVAWERKHWIKNMLTGVRVLKGFKYKSVQLEHVSRVLQHTTDLVEIDGRGKEIDELVWETMDMPAVVVRLS